MYLVCELVGVWVPQAGRVAVAVLCEVNGAVEGAPAADAAASCCELGRGDPLLLNVRCSGCLVTVCSVWGVLFFRLVH